MAQELREKGIADDLIANALAELKVDELANATEVWRKKYNSPPQTQLEWAKQARFLQSRGFGFDIIKKVLSTKD